MRCIEFGPTQGKLYLAGVKDAPAANALGGRITRLCITRGRPAPGMERWQHDDPKVQALAPSADLVFGFYKKSAQDDEAWEEYIRLWNKEKHTPEEPNWQYSEDHEKNLNIMSSIDYRNSIARICDLLEDGVTVVLGCWCVKENRCHRSLVAEDIEFRMRRLEDTRS